MTDVQNGVPVTSSSVPQEYKSRLPSVFFGFFAAPFQAHNAKKRGLKGNRYWAAAAISTFAGVALMAILAVVVGLAASKAINAQDPSINPVASQSGTIVAPQIKPLVLPTESISDSPQTIADSMTGLILKALGNGDARYLDHVYTDTNKSTPGYTQLLAIINGPSRFDTGSATEVSAKIVSPDRKVLSFTLNIEGIGASPTTFPIVFNGAEWLVG